MVSRFKLHQIAKIIRQQGVIAYPTESVYGLGCDPLSQKAVERILQLKQRPVEKGLIIIAANLKQLLPYIDISDAETRQIEAYKKPMTWLVKKSELTPAWVTGNHSKVAIRICQHPQVIEICNLLQHPIVSTSANPAGATPANSALKAMQYFSDRVDSYIFGSTGKLNKPTPITDLQSSSIIRNG